METRSPHRAAPPPVEAGGASLPCSPHTASSAICRPPFPPPRVLPSVSALFVVFLLSCFLLATPASGGGSARLAFDLSRLLQTLLPSGVPHPHPFGNPCARPFSPLTSSSPSFCSPSPSSSAGAASSSARSFGGGVGCGVARRCPSTPLPSRGDGGAEVDSERRRSAEPGRAPLACLVPLRDQAEGQGVEGADSQGALGEGTGSPLTSTESTRGLPEATRASEGYQWLAALRGGGSGRSSSPFASRRRPAFQRRQDLQKLSARVSQAKRRFLLEPFARLSASYSSVPPVTRMYCSLSLLLTALSSSTLASAVRGALSKSPPSRTFAQQGGVGGGSFPSFATQQPPSEPEGLVSPEQLAMHAARVLRAFELWRPFTAGTFFGGPSLGTLLRIYGAYTSLRQMEESMPLTPGSLGSIRDTAQHASPPPSPPSLARKRKRPLGVGGRAARGSGGVRSFAPHSSFSFATGKGQGQKSDEISTKGLVESSLGAIQAARSAEVLTFLLFQYASLAAIAGVLKLPFFASSLSTAALYYNCRVNPEAQASLLMGIKVPQKFLPYGLMAIDVLHAQDHRAALPGLMGICSGELYWLLTQTLPLGVGGSRLLKTPEKFRRLLMRLAASRAMSRK
ncbi:hypothetical protein BESB_036040 [Besnoitia besnoiti]|uniref:Der1-like family protein n=1 Tax=Besnoitia besnoiti TaxID=94643 RepID=A0A2A9MM42_BESBE|nr:hypothetical protein BESB_036040 [Besnoitia besnoiti]PFH37146.1 hypothetical protein BESB_036040 [Besnoitia besnoiti]